MEMNAKLGLLVAAAISFATLPVLADKHEVPKAPEATQEHEYKFEEFKAKHLQRMKENLACVEAAKDFQDLRKCKPERGNRGTRGGQESGSPGKAPAGGTKGGSHD